MKYLLNNKIQFKYDIYSKKGIVVTEKGEYRIDLEQDKIKDQETDRGSGSCGEGYGIHLI